MTTEVASSIQAVTSIVGCLAVVGLAVQLYDSRRASRHQHTITFLLDERRRTYIENLSEVLGERLDLHRQKEPISPEVLAWILSDRKTRARVREMLNYYNSMAL